MAKKLYSRPICIASALLVPFLTLFSPSWLSLFGITPSWAVLWLLPWSLEVGLLPGLISGLYLGFLLDAISLGEISHLPGLVLLGFWWGWLGRYGSYIQGTFNLGLLAWIGSVFLSLTFWIQILVRNFGSHLNSINSWAFQTLLLQATITALFAPFICSWTLLIWRRKKLR